MRTCLTLAAITALVSSQTFAPSTVPLATRQSWCTSQIAACPLLCLQNSTSSATTSNKCDATSLAFSCVCINGISPNASEFSQTMPYFICTQEATDCVAACSAANSACQAACRDDHPCGAQNPTRVNTSTISSTSSASSATGSAGSATTTNSFAAFGGAGSTATSTAAAKSGAEVAFGLGQTYGLAVIASGMFAGFAMML